VERWKEKKRKRRNGVFDETVRDRNHSKREKAVHVTGACAEGAGKERRVPAMKGSEEAEGYAFRRSEHSGRKPKGNKKKQRRKKKERRTKRKRKIKLQHDHKQGPEFKEKEDVYAIGQPLMIC